MMFGESDLHPLKQGNLSGSLLSFRQFNATSSTLVDLSCRSSWAVTDWTQQPKLSTNLQMTKCFRRGVNHGQSISRSCISTNFTAESNLVDSGLSSRHSHVTNWNGCADPFQFSFKDQFSSASSNQVGNKTFAPILLIPPEKRTPSILSAIPSNQPFLRPFSSNNLIHQSGSVSVDSPNRTFLNQTRSFFTNQSHNRNLGNIIPNHPPNFLPNQQTVLMNQPIYPLLNNYPKRMMNGQVNPNCYFLQRTGGNVGTCQYSNEPAKDSYRTNFGPELSPLSTRLFSVAQNEETDFCMTFDEIVQATETDSGSKKKRYTCPYCMFSCSNNGQLRGHVRVHTGEKPFFCISPDCGRTFARNEELTRHQRIHSGFRPHRCDICDKTFSRKDHMNKHKKTHLRSSEKRTHVCLFPGCEQCYTRSDALARHQWTAHKIKPRTRAYHTSITAADSSDS